MRLTLWLLVFMLMIGTLSWYLSPMLNPLPQPLGPYPLATRTITITDQTRKEIYADHDQQRILITHVWYPASNNTGPFYPYLGNAMPAFQQLVAQFYGVPAWLSKWLLRGLMTHAHQDSPCATTAG